MMGTAMDEKRTPVRFWDRGTASGSLFYLNAGNGIREKTSLSHNLDILFCIIEVISHVRSLILALLASPLKKKKTRTCVANTLEAFRQLQERDSNLNRPCCQ